MVQKKNRKGVRLSAGRKVVAAALSALLVLSGCSSYSSDIVDEETPLAAELVAASNAGEEVDPLY